MATFQGRKLDYLLPGLTTATNFYINAPPLP